MKLKAPFPYFGGKSRVASAIWERFGEVVNYVEPFFGSGAVLLGRPDLFVGTETVNDKDGFISNFWRALQAEPNMVAAWADWPVNENDLHARHIWLLGKRESLQERLEGDPDYYDAKIAGWWVWGMSCWIGSGFCAGNGPWQSVDGRITKVKKGGVWRQRPHLGDAGQGVNRKLPHLGGGVWRQLPHLMTAGHGVNRKLPHLGNAGRGVRRQHDGLYEYMQALGDRLRNVRVCCGDWSRICGPSPTESLGLTGVFLDPPYSAEADRDMEIYSHEDGSVAHEVREWAIAQGENPLLRIALCGYDGEHAMPDGWEKVAWKAHGGYGSLGDGRGRVNAAREVVWFSPHCLSVTPGPVQNTLWDMPVEELAEALTARIGDWADMMEVE